MDMAVLTTSTYTHTRIVYVMYPADHSIKRADFVRQNTSPLPVLLLQVLSVFLIQQTKMLYIDDEGGQSQSIDGWY